MRIKKDINRIISTLKNTIKKTEKILILRDSNGEYIKLKKNCW